MFDIQEAGVQAVLKALGWAGRAALKGGKIAYNYHKDHRQQQEIAAQTEAATQPDLPPELASDTKRGVVFGRWKGQYLVKPENMDGHVLIVGGSGSGKSSCIAIPTLRGCDTRVFAIDIKGELYETTKDYRANIKVFNPLDENAYGYDPFWGLRRSHNPAQEAKSIAEAIIPMPPGVHDPFWVESAQNIFTGAILHYSGRGMSFLEMVRAIQSTSPKALIQDIFQSDIREARYFVNSLVDMDDKTIAGIMAELSRHIVTFITDKNLVSALSRKKTVTPADLEYDSDIYIQIPEHLLNQWKNLLAMMVNQFIRHFEQRAATSDRILFLLDEFPRLGKLQAITNGLATLRSRGVNICIIIQSLAQLDEIYGRDNRKVIADNCAYQAILSATDAETQELFSKLVGSYDRPRKRYGKQLEALGLAGSMSEDTSFEKSPIIKPEELRQLGHDLIVLTPYGYCRVKKTPYYLDRHLYGVR